MKSTFCPCVILSLLAPLLVVPLVWAGAYLTKEQALELAFPDAVRIETTNIYLTPKQKARVRRLSGAGVDSSLYTFYRGIDADGQSAGLAAIEAATVRTLPETVMVVLEPDCRVRFVEVLAFFEPEEYLPSGRWLNQFNGKELSRDLRVGGDIQGITGATLSAQAVTRQVRKTAALCGVMEPARQ